jgi:hypothetical protein
VGTTQESSDHGGIQHAARTEPVEDGRDRNRRLERFTHHDRAPLSMSRSIYSTARPKQLDRHM